MLTENPDYPAHLIKICRLPVGGTVTIRPVRADDGELQQTFVRSLSSRTRYYRFFNAISELSPSLLARFTRVDYRRQMTLLAVVPDGQAESLIGVAQYMAEGDEDHCDCALVVQDAWQRRGVGSLLFDSLRQCAGAASYRYMEGDVLDGNTVMLQMAKSRDFKIRASLENPGLKRLRAAIAPPCEIQSIGYGDCTAGNQYQEKQAWI